MNKIMKKIMNALKWIYVLIVAAIAFPFVLATFSVSMLSLGILYFCKVTILPAALIYRMFMPRPKDPRDRSLLRHPLVSISDKLIVLSDWKGV
jgi:hypothetical protein